MFPSKFRHYMIWLVGTSLADSRVLVEVYLVLPDHAVLVLQETISQAFDDAEDVTQEVWTRVLHLVVGVF